MRAYPLFPKRRTHDLNTAWDFKFLSDVSIESLDVKAVAYDDRLPVPSAFDAFPSYAGKRGLGVYRCFVDVTPGIPSLLRVGGAGMTCVVYVDGKLLARHIGTYTPFEVKLPSAPQSRRELVVVTDNRYNYEQNPLHENFFDFYNYGGIIRQVWLEELPVNPISQVHVLTEDLSSGEIRVRAQFDGAVPTLTYSIDGAAPQNAELKTLDGHTAEFSAAVPNPTLWSVETPSLHLLTVDCGADAITVRFGLREVKAEKGEVLLNGKPVKLLGYCRHESHPQFGAATPEGIMVSDLQLLRGMGCNFVRGSHYQQDPRFLDFCDELGFLVFSESLAWGQDKKELTDPKFIDAQLMQTKAMVEMDFNHPSIILWGFLNEGASDAEFARECYTRLIGLIRSLDASRLVTYASNRYLTDLYLSQVDVVSFNIYPGWYTSDGFNERPLGEIVPRINDMLAGLEKLGLSDKPFILSEIGGAAIYGWRDPLHGYWTEEYQADLLKIVCDETVSNDRVAGVALWQFCDCRTYQGAHAMARPRTFNNKGSFDEYRRPKAACEAVKKAFTSFNQKEG